MTDNLQDLIKQIRQTGRAVNKLNYQLELLYQNQWEEKVTNGYENWRFQEDGGVKLVREQLKILDYQCPVCGTMLTEKDATIDHLKPKFKYLGKANSTNNMLIMCRSCNGGKGGKELKDWYKNLPSSWQKRLYNAIKTIHGQIKLIELGLDTIKQK
jgi:5-methylcytosine-specific restriction endonuclease McrA